MLKFEDTICQFQIVNCVKYLTFHAKNVDFDPIIVI